MTNTAKKASSNDVKADREGTFYAALKKEEDGTYTWRGWVVETGPYVSGYQATHSDQGVYFLADKLAQVRRELLAYDRDVEAGEVPEGVEKTPARTEQERKARPYAERLAAANQRARKSLQYHINVAEDQKEKFMKSAATSLAYAIQWSSHAVKSEYVGKTCEQLLQADDENLPNAVQRCKEDAERQLTHNLFSENTTCTYTRACVQSERDATVALLDLMKEILSVYRYNDVETNKED